MALSREQKERIVEGYGERLGRSQVLIWSRFAGLTVDLFFELRAKVRESGSESVVIKTPLMRIALEQADIPVEPAFMNGPSVVTFVYDDIASVARAVVSFAREYTDEFQITGGHVGAKPVRAAQIGTLTTLPSREVLLAQVVGGIQAPLGGLVHTLAAVLRGLLNVLNAHAEQVEKPAD